MSCLKQPDWNRNYVNTFSLKLLKLKPERDVGNYYQNIEIDQDIIEFFQ